MSSPPPRQNAGFFQLIKPGFPCQEENRNSMAKFLSPFFGILNAALQDCHSPECVAIASGAEFFLRPPIRITPDSQKGKFRPCLFTWHLASAGNVNYFVSAEMG
jgi:hypothetical protein